MTLAQERAGIRAGVSSSRASTLKRDLNSLETSRRRTQELNTLERKGLRPATRGRGVWKEPAATGAGGGMAGPLTEPSFAAREYWPDGLVSPDGLFVLPAPKKIVWRDANDVEQIFLPANPSP
ncbi:hypothetical protein [Pseudomonas sp. TUM22785]|uniref:hypothetical protein n=1 Tax=Pseudomonas sp. TUM22785 TaxID=3019098 RepID=UPI00230512C8|nr:hypothetical protein [Pseudomonas sp. TUM22785]WCD79139.1 hypothetical protein PI990_24560 [Pseudomonas sp. TUM22785]